MSDFLQRWHSQVQRTPNAIALSSGTRSLTYQSLYERACRVARAIRARGVQQNDIVAILGTRSIETIVALVGVLEAGAGYLPLDASYPANRLTFMLEDARPTLLIRESKLSFADRPSELPELLLDTNDALFEEGDGAPLELPFIPEHLAYAIYTSGSTGTPKGVAMTRGALDPLITWQIDDSKAGEASPTLQFAPLSFDVHFQELFSTWATGGRLVLVDETLRLEARELLALLEAERVERLFLPFIALQNLADIAVEQKRVPTHLREVITAGEQLQVTRAIIQFFEHSGAELWNHYGPSETHVVTSYKLEGPPSTWPLLPPIGAPLPHVQVRVLDEEQREAAVGETGELYLGGVAVARGYLYRPELTAERFVQFDGVRFYKTGDLVETQAGGVLQFLGRKDGQVKVRGYRIELGEIEARLAALPGVREAAVSVDEPRPTEKRIIGYVVAVPETNVAGLRSRLEAEMPEYMVPALLVRLDALPRTPSGKVDKRALPAPTNQRPDLGVPYAAPRSELEHSLATLWSELLNVNPVGTEDNFFSLGGNSLLALRAVAKTEASTGKRLPITRFFEHPTIAEQARYLSGEVPSKSRRKRRTLQNGHTSVAIIGMAGKFPGADDVSALWALLTEGREGIRRFTPEELRKSVGAEALETDYVPMRGIISRPDLFDARFFGISPAEAVVMDPQQRLLLELSYHALEDAGYPPGVHELTVGVYAGTHNNSYYQELVRPHAEATARIGTFATMTANEKDYVATRIAHRLDLKGPALSIHTACSTSLVAIGTAVHHLRLGLCDLAIAGGASLTVPQESGHHYAEGGMLSSDGHTRSFDAEATGTVFSDGAAMIVLKRLDDALADGDSIYALVTGVGLNNDGGQKSSFTAPSIEGQADVILRAQADAGVDANAIGYVEAHGTATPLGDPIEVEALTQAFRETTDATGTCALGSIKSNFGHLTAAAGVAGVIKTALALQREFLPASLHYQRPNPKIAFETSPFRVQADGQPWLRTDRARSAGVSSFGVGGTNAHLILKEAPQRIATSPSIGPQLLLLSGKSPAALLGNAKNLRATLEASLNDPEAPLLADVAYTLTVGRTPMPHRRALSVRSTTEALEKLGSLEETNEPANQNRKVAFLFPGQGAQYVTMGQNLYEADPHFRFIVDECAEILRPLLGEDLRELLYPKVDLEGARERLKRTEFTQSALFTIEYALASRLESWGIEPAVMVGHSVGEFVAACLAGIFDLKTALTLVARRGQLMQSMPSGAMLSVRLDASEVEAFLPPELDLAADNAPGLCVVAGPAAAIDIFRRQLDERGVLAKPLETSHAFHSRSMKEAEELFHQEVLRVHLSPPQRRILSTLTGVELTSAQATDPAYWSSHLRRAVQFRTAVAPLAKDPNFVLLEVGPRRGLTTLASRRSPGESGARASCVPTLTDRSEDEAEWLSLLDALGRLWTSGVALDLHKLYQGETRRRVSLPGYCFSRESFWLDSAPLPTHRTAEAISAQGNLIMNRQGQLVDELKTLFEQASGLDFRAASTSDDFMSLGVDSLLVTQIALKLKQTYKVPVTFRHLMEEQSSFGALARYLDQQLPASTPSNDAVAVQATPGAAHSPAPLTPPIASNGYGQLTAPQALVAPLPEFPAGGAPSAPNSFVAQLLQMQMAQLALLQQQMTLALGLPVPGLAPTVAPLAPIPRSAVAPSQTSITAAVAPSAPSTPTENNGASKAIQYDVQKAFGAIARIHKQSDELTPAQQARLASFIQRYNQKTKSSKAHTQEYRELHADPRVVTGFKPKTKELTYPIVTVRAEGCRLWDLDGNEYVDALNGFGSGFFGTQNPRINAVLHKKLDEGMEIGPQTQLAGQSAKLVCELTGLDRAAFCNTGSEAVMGALRVARTVTGRPLVVAFSGSYHGIFDEVIVRDTKTMRSVPAAPGILPESVHNILVLDYGSPEALRVIEERADEIAAVLVEPVQSRRPDFQPKEFIKELRALTKEKEIALIFDEVITGFRSHPQGAQHFYGIEADICTYGKVVGGGMPIGVIGGRNPWMDALDGGTWQFGDDSIPTQGVTYFAGTFVRHPLTMAAVHESLLIMKEAGPALQERVNALTTRLANELNQLFRSTGVPMEIRHFSSLWKTFFTEPLPYGELLFVHLRDRGVHIWDGFPCFLTTAHTDREVDFIVNAYRSAIEELQAGEFLPGAPPVKTIDAATPPVPGARLGRDPHGNPAWFVPDPNRNGAYVQLT